MADMADTGYNTQECTSYGTVYNKQPMNCLYGIANSVSKSVGYDPIDTLVFAHDNSIDLVQLYLSEQIIHNRSLRNTIIETSKQWGISLICHGHKPLGSDYSPEEIGAIESILTFQTNKKLILHQSSGITLDHIMASIGLFNSFSIQVCIENYFDFYQEPAMIRSITDYQSLLFHCKEKNVHYSAVFDIPRLFCHEVFAWTNPLSLTNHLLDFLSRNRISTILHCIDFKNASQTRDVWCTLGSGIIPFNDIFTHLITYHTIVEHIILEFEDKELCFLSLEKIYCFYPENRLH